MKKLKLSNIPACKKCKKRGKIVQITNKQWTKDFFSFHKQTGQFELDNSNVDRRGLTSVECVCKKVFSEKDTDKLLAIL